MPIVVREGGYSFVIHTRELPFEPPHVHVRFGGEEVRIELLSGAFMEEPPAGRRRAILQAYRRNLRAVWRTWEALHGESAEGGA